MSASRPGGAGAGPRARGAIVGRRTTVDGCGAGAAPRSRHGIRRRRDGGRKCHELVLDWPPSSIAAPPPALVCPRPSRRHLVTSARSSPLTRSLVTRLSSPRPNCQCTLRPAPRPPRLPLMLGPDRPDPPLRRPSGQAAMMLQSAARVRSDAHVSPTAVSSDGVSPTVIRCGAFAAAMDRFWSARSALCRTCVAAASNTCTRNGAAPEAPTMCLFASRALKQRKLATSASVSAPDAPSAIQTAGHLVHGAGLHDRRLVPTQTKATTLPESATEHVQETEQTRATWQKKIHVSLPFPKFRNVYRVTARSSRRLWCHRAWRRAMG
jgi:hypothetical protein